MTTEIESFDTVPGPTPERPLAVKIAWALALVAGCVAVTWRASQGAAFLGYEMNADTLLAPSWAEDLRGHAYAWIGFQLARSPSLFPDLLLQALARAVSPDARWGIFVYCALQFTGLVFAAGWIVRLIAGVGSLRAVTAAFALLSAAVMIDTLATNATAIPLMWFQSVAHGGSLVAGLAATGLIVRLARRWSWPEGALLFLIVTAAVLSDSLLLVEVVGPTLLAVAAVALLVGRPAFVPAGAVIAVTLAGVLLAQPLDKLVYREGGVPLLTSGFGARIALFAHDLPVFVRERWPGMLLAAFLPLAVFAAYPFLASRLDADAKPSEAGETASLGPVRLPRDAALLWLTGATAFAAVLGATVLLVYEGPSSWRYFVGVAVWPLIFAAALLSRLKRAGRGLAIATAAGAGLVLLSAATAPDARPGPVSWRSPTADCLLAQRDRYGLKAGLAEYWTARQTAFAAGGRLQIEQMGGTGSAHAYGDDAFGKIAQPGRPGEPPMFNYIVLPESGNGPDDATVRGFYGAPTQTFRCEQAGATQVWVYADAPRMTRTALAAFAPPPGSYRNSCNALLIFGDLFAECRRAGGGFAYSRLPVIAQCHGDIRAEDGRLAADCERHFGRLRRLFTAPKPKPQP